jgi:hypothetical protein
VKTFLDQLSSHFIQARRNSMSSEMSTKASADVVPACSREEFLQIFDLYLSELDEDPCYLQARQFYINKNDPLVLQLDRWGSPAEQLHADARAGAGEFLKETAEAIQRVQMLVWHPGMEMQKKRHKIDRFSDAAAQIIESLDPLPATQVIITLQDGVKEGLNSQQKQVLEAWRKAYEVEFKKYRTECKRTGVKGYKEISLFTFVGFIGGLGLGAALDALGFSTSAIGEWAVRTISGEGEDLAEGAWVLKNRLQRRKAKAQEVSRAEDNEEEQFIEEGFVWFEEEDEMGAAEAYGTGKIVGMAAPWVIDAASRLAGVDVHAPEGSYVAYFYSLADQLFATINGLRYHIRRAGSFWKGVQGYFQDPVMVTSFTIVTLPFIGLFLVRSAGWRPDTLFLAAIEGVLLNLCWMPPMTAWVWDWRLQRGLRAVTDRYMQSSKAR